MTHGGRPRREDEKPDSPFGKLLKEYIRRIEGFTQAELANDSGVYQKTLSEMIKGKRIRGTMLRPDLRDIIQTLYRRKALSSLDEANRLITAIPAISALDERDPEDAQIIALFNTPEREREQAAQNEDEAVGSHVSAASENRGDTLVLDGSHLTPFPVLSLSGLETRESREMEKQPRWKTALVLLILMLTLGTVLLLTWPILFRQASVCAAGVTGVTLYTDINYQGQCHTFGPGDYELTRFGLAQNVSSIKNAHDAYHIVLFDKQKNFFSLETSMAVLPAEWDKRADMIHIEKHRPMACHPGTDGILAFIKTDYSGGCLFITQNIPDLTPSNFDQDIVSIQFVGSYQSTRQLVIYRQPDYKDECGAYWQNQSDLLQCARIATSVQVLPFTPPTPIPTVPGTRMAGNVAPQAFLSPGNAGTAVDGNLQTEWVGGHQVGLELHWAFPVTIRRVVVWDRQQSPTDNNQINTLKLSFSDGTSTGSIDMISQGPRCADMTLPVKTITWLQIIPVDASGSNGFREVEVWATTGSQYSNNTCVNKVTMAQTVPA